MSGSSLDYFYMADPAPGLNHAMTAEEHLLEHGCPEAAALVHELVTSLERTRELHRRLADVLHDVEWSISGDYDPADLPVHMQRRLKEMSR